VKHGVCDATTGLLLPSLPRMWLLLPCTGLLVALRSPRTITDGSEVKGMDLAGTKVAVDPDDLRPGMDARSFLGLSEGPHE